jgi:predicted dehydrogenase
MAAVLGRALRYAQVGGGIGSMIGEAHRKGVEPTGAILVAGCFSQSYEKTLELGQSLGVPANRLYRTYSDLIAAERDSPEKPDFAVICTPNNIHYEICKAFLTAGIAVSCDKPLCFAIPEALELQALAKSANLPFLVTFTYTAFAAVKKIRALIKEGAIGTIRLVNAEYPQGWLAEPVERSGNRQAEWRCDPGRSGPVGTAGDIGVHILTLVKWMTNLDIESLSAQLSAVVPGRQLDDTLSVLVKYVGGAPGTYFCSQALFGYNNDLKVRIGGSEGTIQWDNNSPEQFTIFAPGKPPQIVDTGDGVDRGGQHGTIPSFGAFVAMYGAFTATLAKRIAGIEPTPEDLDFPTVDHGLAGVVFTNKVVESSRTGQWVKFAAD